MEEKKHRILIIEDDLDVADMLTAYFRVQGYEVQTANWGEDGVRACQVSPPDLVILDIRLPDIDGYEVARRLRSSLRTARIPIIFLTERRQRSDRLKGLELGADDYITKPFDIQELRLRVRNALRRASMGPIQNPVTNLPEGALVDEAIQERLDSGQEWGALLVSLVNLEAFRERYGFVTSDDVLRAVSLMLQNTVRDVAGKDDFLGHLSPTDFLIMTSPEHVPALAEHVRERVGQALDYFYPLKDRLSGNFGDRKLALRMREIYSSDGEFKAAADLKNAFLGR